MIVKEFVTHYSLGRPHSALGPGIPEPPQVKAPAVAHRHKHPAGYSVESKPHLGGLHHEYRLAKEAAYHRSIFRPQPSAPYSAASWPVVVNM